MLVKNLGKKPSKKGKKGKKSIAPKKGEVSLGIALNLSDEEMEAELINEQQELKKQKQLANSNKKKQNNKSTLMPLQMQDIDALETQLKQKEQAAKADKAKAEEEEDKQKKEYMKLKEPQQQHEEKVLKQQVHQNFYQPSEQEIKSNEEVQEQRNQEEVTSQVKDQQKEEEDLVVQPQKYQHQTQEKSESQKSQHQDTIIDQGKPISEQPFIQQQTNDKISHPLSELQQVGSEINNHPTVIIDKTAQSQLNNSQVYQEENSGKEQLSESSTHVLNEGFGEIISAPLENEQSQQQIDQNQSQEKNSQNVNVNQEYPIQNSDLQEIKQSDQTEESHEAKIELQQEPISEKQTSKEIFQQKQAEQIADKTDDLTNQDQQLLKETFMKKPKKVEPTKKSSKKGTKGTKPKSKQQSSKIKTFSFNLDDEIEESQDQQPVTQSPVIEQSLEKIEEKPLTTQSQGFEQPIQELNNNQQANLVHQESGSVIKPIQETIVEQSLEVHYEKHVSPQVQNMQERLPISPQFEPKDQKQQSFPNNDVQSDEASYVSIPQQKEPSPEQQLKNQREAQTQVQSSPQHTEEPQKDEVALADFDEIKIQTPTISKPKKQTKKKTTTKKKPSTTAAKGKKKAISSSLMMNVEVDMEEDEQEKQGLSSSDAPQKLETVNQQQQEVNQLQKESKQKDEASNQNIENSINEGIHKEIPSHLSNNIVENSSKPHVSGEQQKFDQQPTQSNLINQSNLEQQIPNGERQQSSFGISSKQENEQSTAQEQQYEENITASHEKIISQSTAKQQLPKQEQFIDDGRDTNRHQEEQMFEELIMAPSIPTINSSKKTKKSTKVKDGNVKSKVNKAGTLSTKRKKQTTHQLVFDMTEQAKGSDQEIKKAEQVGEAKVQNIIEEAPLQVQQDSKGPNMDNSIDQNLQLQTEKGEIQNPVEIQHQENALQKNTQLNESPLTIEDQDNTLRQTQAPIKNGVRQNLNNGKQEAVQQPSGVISLKQEQSLTKQQNQAKKTPQKQKTYSNNSQQNYLELSEEIKEYQHRPEEIKNYIELEIPEVEITPIIVQGKKKKKAGETVTTKKKKKKTDTSNKQINKMKIDVSEGLLQEENQQKEIHKIQDSEKSVPSAYFSEQTKQRVEEDTRQYVKQKQTVDLVQNEATVNGSTIDEHIKITEVSSSNSVSGSLDTKRSESIQNHLTYPVQQKFEKRQVQADQVQQVKDSTILPKILKEQINMVNFYNDESRNWLRQKIMMMKEDMRGKLLRREERRKVLEELKAAGEQSVPESAADGSLSQPHKETSNLQREQEEEDALYDEIWNENQQLKRQVRQSHSQL